jgi:hypothetical protein
MSTLQDNRPTRRLTAGKILIAAGVIIAIAISAAFLTLSHANHTQPSAATHTQQLSQYLPTIQYPGGGVAHIVIDPETGQAHGTVSPAIRGR